MKSNPVNKDFRKINAIWDYVFSDSPSIPSTIETILNDLDISDFLNYHDEIHAALFEGLKAKLSETSKPILAGAIDNDALHQIRVLRIYQALCYLPYTEPNDGVTLCLPIYDNATGGGHWHMVDFTIQSIPLVGQGDSAYTAYKLVPEITDHDPHPVNLLLLPGTSPLPWQKGSMLTYFSDITPFMGVGEFIYQRASPKLDQLLGHDSSNTIAMGHSLGGAVACMLGCDHPEVVVRAFSAPMHLSSSMRHGAGLIQLSAVITMTYLFQTGFPILAAVAIGCCLMAILPTLQACLMWAIRSGLTHSPSYVNSNPPSAQDGLPHHLIVSQEYDVVSFVGDKNYASDFQHLYLQHSGQQKNIVRAHTQAFTHLPGAQPLHNRWHKAETSFVRIWLNAYWECCGKPSFLVSGSIFVVIHTLLASCQWLLLRKKLDQRIPIVTDTETNRPYTASALQERRSSTTRPSDQARSLGSPNRSTLNNGENHL